MRFETGCATDQGMVREANQDRYLVHGNLVAVADGMGGHAGGELAAETAVEDLRRFGPVTETKQLVAGIHHANREVLAAAERTGMTNMGTTLVAALLRPQRRSVVVGNVGDSRAYLFTRGELDQITKDHSLVEDLVQAGKISAEEARDHPHRNVVTRVLGLGDDPEVDTFELAVSAGDLFLLASDGLFNEVDHHVIATILSNEDDLDEASRRLVERANQNGGHDNITVLIGRVVEDGPEASAPASAAKIVADQIAESSSDTVVDAPSDEHGSPSRAEVHVDGAHSDDTPAAGISPGVEESSVFSGSGGVDDAAIELDHSDSEVADAMDPPTDEIPVVRKRSPRRFRAFVFAVCVLALLGLGVGGLVAYGTNAWFVDTVGNEIVIHRGRPGGVPFVEPQRIQPTGIDINDLNPGSRRQVADVPVFGSLEAAESFVDQLELSTLRTSE